MKEFEKLWARDQWWLEYFDFYLKLETTRESLVMYLQVS